MPPAAETVKNHHADALADETTFSSPASSVAPTVDPAALPPTATEMRLPVRRAKANHSIPMPLRVSHGSPCMHRFGGTAILHLKKAYATLAHLTKRSLATGGVLGDCDAAADVDAALDDETEGLADCDCAGDGEARAVTLAPTGAVDTEGRRVVVAVEVAVEVAVATTTGDFDAEAVASTAVVVTRTETAPVAELYPFTWIA